MRDRCCETMFNATETNAACPMRLFVKTAVSCPALRGPGRAVPKLAPLWLPCEVCLEWSMGLFLMVFKLTQPSPKTAVHNDYEMAGIVT